MVVLAHAYVQSGDELRLEAHALAVLANDGQMSSRPPSSLHPRFVSRRTIDRRHLGANHAQVDRKLATVVDHVERRLHLRVGQYYSHGVSSARPITSHVSDST